VDGAPRAFDVMLPPRYDGTRPYPLVFGFHGATRTHLQCRDEDCRGLQERFGAQAIMVYMKSPGVRWRDASTGFSANVAFFDAVLATVERDQCIDESRVVVAGTSSGASFANVLACVRAERLLAVVPVAGEPGDAGSCSTPVAALVVHGIDDSHVTFDQGEASRDDYRARNHCSERTTPGIEEAHRAVRAARDAGRATYRCVDYSGCADGVPVRWCEHGEGGWDNSTHAWPTFGGQMIADFLDTLH
jgi:polyhydroxybutyrate depolymerase